MRQVAAAAGVSLKTVSRVHNDDPHVSPETRERVRVAMRELGYSPNPLATTFRTGRTGMLGVVVPDLADPFFAELVAAIDRHARTSGLAMVATSAAKDAAGEPDVVRSLLERQIDALILAPTGADHAYLQPWAERVPMVFVDRPPQHLAVPAILNDDHRAVELALTELVARGCRRVVLGGGIEGTPTTAARQRAFRALAAEHGVEGFVTDEAAAVALVRSGRADGVLGCSPQSSVTVLRALRPIGVPLASIGDFPMSDLISPPPVVVDQAPAAIGRAAVDTIRNGITDPQVQIIAVHLIARTEAETSHA